jgi:cytochrome b
LGALSVFALLAVLLLQVGTGLISDDEIAFSGPLVRFVSGDTIASATGYHKNIGKFIVMGLVVLHLLAILFYKLVQKQSLVRPMVVGDKQLSVAALSARDSAGSRLLALVVLGICAGLVRWLVSLGAFAGY